MLGATALADGGNISGATTSTLTIDPVALSDGAPDYHVLVTGSCPAPVNSVDAELTINNSPVITVQPINMSVCDGGSVSFKRDFSGAGFNLPVDARWRGFSERRKYFRRYVCYADNQPGYGSGCAADYSVVVTGACPTSTTSVDVSLTINADPVITIQQQTRQCVKATR